MSEPFVPRILFNFASRERPERFFTSLHNIIDMCQDKEHYTIHAILDRDDPCFEQYQPTIDANSERFKNVVWNIGYSKSKIDAINRKLPDVEWDILINWADDMVATVFGFDALIKQWFYSVFPEGDGLLHLSDFDAKSAVPVLYVADKKYYARDNYIYHPGYESLFSDNDSMEMAKLRGRYHFIGEIIFNHKNPAYGHLPRDSMFNRQQDLWAKDEAFYLERKAKNFEL